LSLAGLKVHKIEIFFGFDFEICIISLFVYQKKNFIGPLLGEVRFFRVVLGLRGMKKNFELGQKNFFFSFVTPLYLLKIVFPKFDPITAPGMALRVNLGPKCQHLFPLV
jgi:hypothetical protein